MVPSALGGCSFPQVRIEDITGKSRPVVDVRVKDGCVQVKLEEPGQQAQWQDAAIGDVITVLGVPEELARPGPVIESRRRARPGDVRLKYPVKAALNDGTTGLATDVAASGGCVRVALLDEAGQWVSRCLLMPGESLGIGEAMPLPPGVAEMMERAVASREGRRSRSRRLAGRRAIALIGLAAVTVLVLVLAFMYLGAGRHKEPAQKEPAAEQLASDRNLRLLTEAGVLKKADLKAREARISGEAWRRMNTEQKKETVAMLAQVFEAGTGSREVSLVDDQTGNVLARSSAFSGVMVY